MQEVAPSDRTDLTLSKKSCRRNEPESLSHDPAIMMGVIEESLPTSAAPEQEGPEGGIVVFRSILSQAKV